MILTIIAKQRTSADGSRKWYAFSTLRKGRWYDVRFVHDAAPPKVYDVDKPNKIMRAFVRVDPEQVDVTNKGGRDIVYVNDWSEPTKEELKTAVDEERKKIEEFRKKREFTKQNFFDDNDAPSSVDLPDPSPDPDDDDIPI